MHVNTIRNGLWLVMATGLLASSGCSFPLGTFYQLVAHNTSAALPNATATTALTQFPASASTIGAVTTTTAGTTPSATVSTAASAFTQAPTHLFFHPIITFPMPIPVSPFFQKRLEDKFWNKERYERVPILGPITSSGPPVALDPPSPDEVMRALEKAQPLQGGVPLLHEKMRNNVRMIIEPIADYVDPPRVYPLIGPAQLHHAHYKCTIFYEQITRVGWPIPHTRVDEDSREVIYIDHNHFHMVGCDDNGATAGL